MLRVQRIFTLFVLATPILNVVFVQKIIQKYI